MAIIGRFILVQVFDPGRFILVPAFIPVPFILIRASTRDHFIQVPASIRDRSNNAQRKVEWLDTVAAKANESRVRNQCPSDWGGPLTSPARTFLRGTFAAIRCPRTRTLVRKHHKCRDKADRRTGGSQK